MENINTQQQQDEITEYLQQLPKKSAQLLLADYENEKRLLAEGLITEEEFQAYKLMINIRISNLPADTPPSPISKTSFFLSYSRRDYDVAIRLKDEFALHGVHLVMDIHEVTAGENIKEFILKEIRNNKSFIVLVSKNSLSSGWVSHEITLAAFSEKLNNRCLVPIGIDESYRDNKFYDTVINKLDKKLKDIAAKIQTVSNMGNNTAVYDEEKSKLLSTKEQFPYIIKMLRSKSIPDLSIQESFSKTIKEIAEDLLRRNDL